MVRLLWDENPPIRMAQVATKWFDGYEDGVNCMPLIDQISAHWPLMGHFGAPPEMCFFINKTLMCWNHAKALKSCSASSWLLSALLMRWYISFILAVTSIVRFGLHSNASYKNVLPCEAGWRNSWFSSNLVSKFHALYSDCGLNPVIVIIFFRQLTPLDVWQYFWDDSEALLISCVLLQFIVKCSLVCQFVYCKFYMRSNGTVCSVIQLKCSPKHLLPHFFFYVRLFFPPWIFLSSHHFCRHVISITTFMIIEEKIRSDCQLGYEGIGSINVLPEYEQNFNLAQQPFLQLDCRKSF